MKTGILSALGSLVVGAAMAVGGQAAETETKTHPEAHAKRQDVAPRESHGVGGQMRRLVEADWIDADGWFALAGDKANQLQANANHPVAQPVTTAADAAGGCDGVKNGRCGFHTASGETDPWWQVDLGRPVQVDRVVVFNRTDAKTAPRTRNIRLLVSDAENAVDFSETYRHDGSVFYGVEQNGPLVIDLHDKRVNARFVRLMVPGRCSFALDEVEVYPVDNPEQNVALNRPADQKSIGPYSRTEKRLEQQQDPGDTADSPSDTSRGGGFRLAHTRLVVERGRRLVARLRSRAKPGQLVPLADRLDALDDRLTALEEPHAATDDERQAVYLDARRLVRQIAFTNPMLDFDEILFVKRHDPGGLYHMVHQYYGFCQKPGGGLFVLHDPFSDHPRVTNLLADSVVERGRLRGQQLTPGTFVSPDLSFDGRSILFAYTQGRGDGIEWSPRASFHIFQVNPDGSGLVQLTDGKWNDFDPCYLPGGRMAFISERRGGYLRCGGSAPPYDSPTYTLHSMERDGSDICCLSFHETQEWHPSVDHHGMLIYTRWDYVDRDTNVAHHIWSCYPDGRDPRSYHGNYPTRRESRPWMEMSCRAVPGSHRYVATAAAHHGLAFGSLVLIDYRPEDDGGTSQLERITPEVPFPESKGGKPLIRQQMCYGTAWPLSEDDYLCVYDPGAKNRGIYWIDRDGNRELLYRDPEISCLSPIPLRPRPVPPALPHQTTQSLAAEKTARSGHPATISVMNVYDGDFDWPPDTKIKALRVVQVLPKTTPPVDQPRIGIATETNARAVLGTVPVEADGSAYFEAPVGKPLYFQALDGSGLAVQSMRSATYVHPGEQLTCQGCHEAKRHQAIDRRQPPLATLRPPSPITPGPDGSHPLNYPRLVQPVLDRHCVGCHREKGALDLSGTIDGPHGWTRSYTNLSQKYGFYFTVGNGTINRGIHGGARTTPGRFGAHAAKLTEYLDEGHYDVRLPPHDYRRVTLWLDCNSEFYGTYENTDAQARGEVVWPSLE